ncbi:hypothetical protein [Piscinibacter koreensis]|uniref:Tannase/feruloyl esterase family alpha/beta hydrolase n=1 Tax=Piscinibacter koreensis TaxID=2742824 RepID=A0A7Y6NK42_9BURK|nr:hypothetical protein [Schlegelella koreensis]NUZ04651.1 hypothetical protein [Schlegelella koreensis]
MRDLQLTSALQVAATATVPAYCDVRGTIKGNVNFAVYLPREWNGRFQMVGNGGKTVSGVTSTRPHCPYPTEAVYNGGGDVNAAASYTCRVP